MSRARCLRTLALLFLVPLPHMAQQRISTTEAMILVERLEADPLHKDARHEMDLFLEWIIHTDDAFVVIADDQMNAMIARDVPYARAMYFLVLGGMARYDVAHHETRADQSGIDRPAGLDCMCTGLDNLKRMHPDVKVDRYFRRMCRKR
jgi:hypothetical protein